MRIFSRWMFVAVLGLLATQAQAQFHSRPGEVFVCKSSGYQQNYCGADTRDGVRMTRQLSNSACTEGRSWGYDRRGVWVSNGCEAEFMVGGRNPGPIYDRGPVRGRVIRCESNDYQQQYCRADTRGGVWLQRQVSNSDCTRGRSWGFDDGGVWVSDGCKGDFAVGNGWGDRGGLRPPVSMRIQDRVVRCESTNGRTVQCAVDTRGGVRLASQISNSSCIQGRSWGWDRRGIWVSNGCRADFRVGGYYR